MTFPRRLTNTHPAVPREKPLALVVLSGGMDSVAAMHWAIESCGEVCAVSFAYGQVNRDAELMAAQRIATRRGVPWSSLYLCEAVRGLATLSAPKPGAANGISFANLACRNIVLLSVAAAEACRAWLGQRVQLVIGANLDDAATFPDCRAEFVEAASRAINFAACGVADLYVVAPWANKRKADILGWCAGRPDALDDVRESMSCYRGTRCGECDPCRLRAAAFAAHGLADGAWLAEFTGGDPARTR